MTDREAVVAVFKAVDELAVRLTGKPLTVNIETAEGVVTIGPWTASESSDCRSKHQSAPDPDFDPQMAVEGPVAIPSE